MFLNPFVLYFVFVTDLVDIYFSTCNPLNVLFIALNVKALIAVCVVFA